MSTVASHARASKPSVRPASSRRQRRQPLALVQDAAPPTAPSQGGSGPTMPPPADPGALTSVELWDHVAFVLNVLANLVRAHRSIVTGADVVILLLNSVQGMITRWAADGARDGAMFVEHSPPHGLHVWLDADGKQAAEDRSDEEGEGADEPALNRCELAGHLLGALANLELAGGSIHLANQATRRAVEALSGHRPNVTAALDALRGTSAEGGEALEQLWFLGGELSSMGALVTGQPESTGLPRMCAALARVESGEALPQGTMATKKQSDDREAPAGTVEWRGERAYARLLLVDGSRPRIPLGKGLSKAEAEKQKDELQAKAWSERWTKPKGDAAPGPGGETVAKWFERYFAHREERKIKGLRQERSRFETHLKPTFGERPIAGVTRRDLEAFVSELDTRVRAGELSWRSALHAWSLLSHGFKEAQGSKRLDLRMRDDNPADGVRGPDRGREKTKQLLYPSEVTAILSCDRVPLRWKRLIALAVYTYLRPGELAALDWQDIDLAHGVAHVHQAESDDGETLDTKTGTTRLVPIEPSLVPLLDVLRREQGQRGRLVPSMPPEEDLSERLRKYAKWAGVSRASLFVGAKHKSIKQLTWYDLRATGITWRAVRGDSPTKIHIAAGHDEFTTTLGYIRLAEGAAHGFGEPFPPLPPCLQSTSPVHPEGAEELNSGEDRAIDRVPSGIRTRLQRGNTGLSGPSSPVDRPEGPRKPPEAGEWTGKWTEGERAAMREAAAAALGAGDLATARALIDALEGPRRR